MTPEESRGLPVRLGLTGGLASGKSTVARLLSDTGFRVVDADELVAELHGPGAAGSRAVAELFGESALDSSGAVDRGAVAAKIFTDPAARRALEAALHPLVRGRFAEIAAAAAEPVVVLEATLLVEAGYAPDFDLVVTVEADPEVRLARAVERGLEAADARARMQAQGDGETRRQAAGWTIRNEGSLADLSGEVERLVAELEGRVTKRGEKGES